MLPIELLKEKKRGEFLTHEEVNALIRNAQSKARFNNGYSSTDLTAISEKIKTSPRYIHVSCNEEIPPYSVFGITTGSGDTSPYNINASRIGDSYNGSPLALFTNDSLAVEVGSKGFARPIGLWDPVKLQGAGVTGMPCGPWNSFSVTSNRFGLTCVGQSESGYIWAIKGVEPHAIVGVTVGGISPRVNNVPGSGLVRVMYRDDGGTLRAAPKPGAGGSWLTLVYNICDEEILSGVIVKSEQVLGVGYVVEMPCAPLSSSSSSSPSSSSSSPPSSSSSSPPSSSSSPPSISSSSSIDCLDTIEGRPIADIPVADVANVVYLFGEDSNGCIVKVPLSECNLPGSASSS